MRLSRSPLIRLRLAAGLASCAAAASALGISPNYLGLIERGAARPGGPLMVRMGKAYHVKPATVREAWLTIFADLARRTQEETP